MITVAQTTKLLKNYSYLVSRRKILELSCPIPDSLEAELKICQAVTDKIDVIFQNLPQRQQIIVEGILFQNRQQCELAEELMFCKATIQTDISKAKQAFSRILFLTNDEFDYVSKRGENHSRKEIFEPDA